MTKISLAAAYHICAYLSRIVTLLLICSVSALAKNNCETNASQINPANFTHSEIGGTGTPIAHSGIGGTGIRDGGTGGTGNQESGIGGTGSVASDGGVGGTGIVGVITGFASICANGIEIHYDVDTPVSIDGRLSTVRDLAVGQVIAVRALGTTNHELTASHIAVIHAAVGPISRLNPETQELYVLGQAVQVGQLKDHNNFSNLKNGDWVQVSGHRLSSGIIVASRIESTTPQSVAEAGINGYVTRIDTKGFEVNGTRIDHDAQLPPGITQGVEVRIVGHWDGAHLKAQHIQIEPTRQSIGNVEHLVIEGYIHALDDKGLNINNQVIEFESAQISAGNTRSDFRLDQRIQISGRLGTDQRVIAERIELKHELPVQLQERNDRSQIDGSGKGNRKNNLENEPEIKSAKGNENSQTQRDGHSDGKQERNDRSQIDKNGRDDKKNNLENGVEIKPAKGNENSQTQHDSHNDGNKDSLKKEIDHNSRGNHASDSVSRSENPSSSFKDEKNLDDSGSSWREDAGKLQDSREQKLQGSQEQNSSDYQAISQLEKVEKPDVQDRPDSHRDSLRDNDIPDRAIDHRDSLRDIDISDRVRDHGMHHDRHFDRY